MAGGEPRAPESARLDIGAIRARAGVARATAEAHPPGNGRDLRGSAEHVLATEDVPALLAEVQRLYAYVAMLEDCVLAGAELLWPGEDWGPKPGGAGESYVAYLGEGYYETACEIHKREVCRA